MHYYQFNIADYRKDTQHLTPIEHYIYRELMDWYYLDESPIPKKTQPVLRRLRLVSENNQDLQNVLDEFFTQSDEGWIHGRIEAEITEYRKKAETARANGSKGGRPKKPKKTQPVIIANPEITGSKANHKPLTNNHKPIHTGFDSFYAAYPRKSNKQAAIQAWNKRKPDADLAALIAKDIERRITLGHWDLSQKDYIPHPSTYLNQERWTDEITPRNDNATNRSAGNTATPGQKLTPAQRTAAKRESLRRSQSPDLGALATDGGDVRPPVALPTR